MQDNVMQVHAQPFVKLAQSNMELFNRFSTSSEVASEATAQATHFFQQATESAMKLMQSGAYAHLMQGMLKNYTEFLSELGHGSMALMSQGQAALVRQTNEATESVIETVEARGRRTRS